MHSHIPEQEVDLLAAPLIVRSAEDVAADRQEVVPFLHDFSVRSGVVVLKEISAGQAMHHGAVRQSSHTLIAVLSGERAEMMLHNMSMMVHPMHLHVHIFQVVDINGERIAGAIHHTVHIPHMGMVSVAFDAGEIAPWMLHCHPMAHRATAMTTELDFREG